MSLPERHPASYANMGHLSVDELHPGSTSSRLQPPSAVPREGTASHELLGDSEPIRKLRTLVARIAPVDSTVLLTGESGCGKELCARVLHDRSHRARGPLVAVNCATLSETLLESELFGHEKGAFTGADRRRTGQFERADGGTLFLDEVGEIPLNLQAKLLRALQEREIERLGGQTTIQVDVRVVAATNRDLEREVAAGRFRGDLFYRLNVIALEMPPLRKRRADVPILVNHFLRRHARHLKRPAMSLSREAREALVAHDWPGNVRELSNAVERAVVLAPDAVIRPEDLPEAVLASPTELVAAGGFHEAVHDFKRRFLAAAMKQGEGNVSRVARDLGLSPSYLHRLIRNLDLQTELDRSRKPIRKDRH